MLFGDLFFVFAEHLSNGPFFLLQVQMDCTTCTECVKSSKIVDESSVIVTRSESQVSLDYCQENLAMNDTTPSDYCESYIVQQALKEEQAKLKSINDCNVADVEQRSFHLARTATLMGDKHTLKNLLSKLRFYLLIW